MANARAVEEVPKSGKTRTKTSIFWSTVPEKEQFRNVQVPGVALDRFKDAKNNTQAQKYVQVVQKSKSDSAISNTRSDPLTVNKQGKTGHKFAVKQNDLSGKRKDASSIFKGASSDQLANISTLSESTKARRASLKNLNVEDKKRVANLIKELAKTGEERELALERLQEERVSFDEQLGTVQEEQTALKQEREALKQRLEKSEKLLKKYESELKDVKIEKEEQEKILKKKFHAQPQSTQTSPLIQNFSTDGTTKSGRFKSEQDDIQPRGTKKTRSTQAYIGDSESNDRDGRRRWSTPQVPVYSNSLFDVKVSNVEHEQNSETRSVSEEYQRSSVVESGSLHELYLREYSLQLRLQEQQIEIQRQQVQLQQQLQLLQQQQQQQQGRQQQEQQQQQQHQPELAKQQQRHQEQNNQQQGLIQQREKHNEQHSYQENQEQHVHNQHEPLEYKQKHSNADHKHQHKKQEWRKQSNQQTLHSHQLQPLDQQEPQYPSEQKNEDIFTQSSPTQQTNLLQKRTPERKGHKIEPKHRADTNIPHEHASHSPRQRHGHDHHQRVVENLRHGHEHEDVFDGQNGEPQTKDRSYTPSGSPSHRHYHHSGHDVEKTRFAEEHQTNRNKGQHGTDSTSFEQRHVSKRKSPRKHDRANYAKQIDLNNNEYFQPKSHSQQKSRYDINDNLAHDHYPQEYLSESYSETDDDVEQDHYSSERPCHCGYYHNHTMQQHATLEYDQPISNHSHSTAIPTNSYHQRLLHDPKHTRVPENRPPLGHHHHLHKGEYHHRADIREEHHGAPHYVTHKHEGESEYEAAFYQPSQEISNKHQPTERRTYTRHQSRSPTGALLSPQVGKTEHDYLPSDGLQYSRSQMNRDRSKYLLDDYIYNHRPAGQDNAKSNAGYEPRDTGNKHSTKRKMSRKSHGNTEIEGEENGHLALPYLTSQQIQYEDENPNPSYSLYKPNIPHPTREQSEYPRIPPGHNYDQYSRKRYPNSLVEIVEDLEIHSGYEERYSEETEMYSTEEPGYDSDEEESTVLDNIFFLKR